MHLEERTSDIFNSLMLIRGMCDGNRPRFTASLPRRFYGGVINFHVEKPRGHPRPECSTVLSGGGSGSTGVIYGPSEMFWAGDPFSIPRPAIPRLFLKRSFVLIAAIDRSSARRSLYVRRKTGGITSCLYHFNVLSALTSIACITYIYSKVILLCRTSLGNTCAFWHKVNSRKNVTKQSFMIILSKSNTEIFAKFFI